MTQERQRVTFTVRFCGGPVDGETRESATAPSVLLVPVLDRPLVARLYAEGEWPPAGDLVIRAGRYRRTFLEGDVAEYEWEGYER